MSAMNTVFATAVCKIQDYQENDDIQVPDKLQPVVIIAPSKELTQATAELGIYFEYNDPSSMDISEIICDLSKFSNSFALNEDSGAILMDFKPITHNEFLIVEQASEILRYGIDFHYLSNAIAMLYISAENNELNEDEYTAILESENFVKLTRIRPALAELLKIVFKPKSSIAEIEQKILDHFKS